MHVNQSCRKMAVLSVRARGLPRLLFPWKHAAMCMAESALLYVSAGYVINMTMNFACH